MGMIEIAIQLATKPLGFIGVILALVGLYYGLASNFLGWVGFTIGIVLAFVSEKG